MCANVVPFCTVWISYFKAVLVKNELFGLSLVGFVFLVVVCVFSCFCVVLVMFYLPLFHFTRRLQFRL